jgi:hypothetical protein
MSIINDALKKAERDGNGGKSVKTIGIELKRKKQGLNWGPVFVVLILLLVAGPVVAPMFSTPFKRDYSGALKTTAPDAASVTLASADDAGTRRGQFGVEEVPRPAMMQAAMPGFVLSGLIYSDKESYCLINGQVVKQGEFINGAKLVRVTKDEAVLDFRGKQIILPVAN